MKSLLLSVLLVVLTTSCSTRMTKTYLKYETTTINYGLTASSEIIVTSEAGDKLEA